MNNKVWFLVLVSGLLLMAYLKLSWGNLVGFLTVDQPPEVVDVIVVLSGGSEREIVAAELYRQGYAGKVIMTGVSPAAQTMAARAAERGVPYEDIIIENQAISTYENAVFAKKIMLQQHFKSAIVVSSDYHMRRSRMVFERVFKDTGIGFLYCAARNDSKCRYQHPTQQEKVLIVKEYIKLIYYCFRYW